MRPLALLAAPLVALSLAAAPALADTTVSSGQLRSLARQAQQDPTALDRLREVRQVDGRPADVGAALQGASGDDLRRRLEALAASVDAGGAGPVAGIDAQRQAHDVLGERRFKPPAAPRPLRGVFHQIGRWLLPVAHWLAPVGRLFQAIGRTPWALIAVGLAVIAVVAFAASRLVRRRLAAADRVAGPGAGPFAIDGPLDPRRMEQEADKAEAVGDLDHAFRLRFIAGLIRLDRAGALRFRPSLTTGEVVRSVPSPTLRPLANAFDEIAYGGRPTQPADLDAVRAGMPRVLEEAGRR
jgi:hypothetical protein